MSDAASERYATVLADDVPEHLDVMRSILEASERFEIVATASTGTEAISAAARCTPDLVVLDINMPEMDGLEALPMIRTASPASKVVLVSGVGPDELRAPAIGAADHLAKDLPPATIVQRILKVMADPTPQPAPDMSTFRAPARSPLPSAVHQMTPEEMVSVIAHEVRNHLAVIQGFGLEIHTRWDELPNDMKRDSVRRMTERARYLNAVVNNLMFMRRLDSGHVWKDAVAINLDDLIQGLSTELQDLARGHRLDADVKEGLPRVTADPQRLRQVVTNLVVNAARFSPSDDAIELSAGRDERGVWVRVSDRGPGIPKPHRDRIFEKFTRLESKGSGIGLGLFISRELMRSMNGDLVLEDTEEGSGAVFTCLLPRAPDGD